MQLIYTDIFFVLLRHFWPSQWVSLKLLLHYNSMLAISLGPRQSPSTCYPVRPREGVSQPTQFFFFFIVFSHYYKNAVSRVNGPVGMELWLGMYIFNLVGLQMCFFMLSRFHFEATSGWSTSECPHGKRQNPKQKDSKEGIVSLGSCS